MAEDIKRAVTAAMHAADKEISAHANRGGLYARGLAGEGYAGGYREAMQDVLLALNDVTPSSRFWEESEAK